MFTQTFFLALFILFFPPAEPSATEAELALSTSFAAGTWICNPIWLMEAGGKYAREHSRK